MARRQRSNPEAGAPVLPRQSVEVIVGHDINGEALIIVEKWRALELAAFFRAKTRGTLRERAPHLYASAIELLRERSDDPDTLPGSVVFDAAHRSFSHTDLVRMLREGFGLVSAYHAFTGEEQGKESAATLYYQWKRDKPFHVDYCFVPETWVPALTDVTVGGFDDWATSDHRPLVVSLDGNLIRERLFRVTYRWSVPDGPPPVPTR